MVEKLSQCNDGNNNDTVSNVRQSLVILAKILTQYYGKKPYILIDEYDTPFLKSWLSENKEHKELLSSMHQFLSETLKSNDCNVSKAILTGIHRISFGLTAAVNNMTTYSILEDVYHDHFGFSMEEIESLYRDSFNGASLKEDDKNEMTEWYNGYTFGNRKGIFNPISILNYFASSKVRSYWKDAASAGLIDRIIDTISDDDIITMTKIDC